jgi:KUP system potassium uptake protein
MNTDRSTGAKGASALVIAALGVVYGDIGTSPLYAFRESLGGAHGIGTAPGAVLGVLSMIFWAVTIVISLKYVLLVLMADNDGEGGDLALLALVLRQLPSRGRLRRGAIVLGLISASMFYGDSVITPAISVLSAVEGLKVVSSAFERLVLPLTLVILLGLFVAQRFGTGRVGRVFGPVMLLWFAVLALLGIAGIARNPAVLEALDPLVAARFAFEHPALTMGVMAAVFLSLTGGEALYADMGHFGRRPIRVAWFWIVMPCLMLNYFGQGALVLTDPKAAENPFFLLAPDWLQLPLVALATCATVIASQAVISGAFSMTSQAVKLGFLPRMLINYTSETHAGQIYVPFVNWLLLVMVVLLVVGFGSSSNLAAAYGIAVATSMAITTLGVLLVARLRWDWPLWRVVLVFVPLMAIDWVFLVSNAAKIPHGGWFPLAFGLCLFLLFTTWKRGRSIVNHELEKTGIALQPFLKSLSIYPPVRVEGTAVFMTQETGLVPHALLHNLKHNRVLHERVVFLTAIARNVPHVDPEDMAEVTDLEEGCFQVVVQLGFQDAYDVNVIFDVLARQSNLELVVNECSFFLSRQNVLAQTGQGMWRWRQRLFGWMLRNAQPASDFFRIPPNRVIEIGTQVVI